MVNEQSSLLSMIIGLASGALGLRLVDLWFKRTDNKREDRKDEIARLWKRIETLEQTLEKRDEEYDKALDERDEKYKDLLLRCAEVTAENAVLKDRIKLLEEEVAKLRRNRHQGLDAPPQDAAT